jgi:hypothetical protein
MKTRITRIFPFLLSCFLSEFVYAAQYYVAPNGSAQGNGSQANPWDLQTALNQPASIHAGDTVWLRGGTYSGNYSSVLTGTQAAPIIVRQFPGERSTIDSGAMPRSLPALTVRGADTWYWGFELMDSNPSRDFDTASRQISVMAYGLRLKFINMVLHDGLGGFGWWTTNSPDDGEIYGNLIYNVGAGPSGSGHSIYMQNALGKKRVVDSIMFNGFSFGIHAYTEGGNIDNIELEGNVSFNHGILSPGQGPKANFLYRGPSVANPVMKDNMGYNSPFTSSGRSIDVNTCTNGVFTGNYMAGGTAANMGSCVPTTMTSNSLYGATFGVPATGNIVSGSKPTGTQVFVRPNKYETGRANVIIYNWSQLPTVNVDLSGSGLAPGQSFEIRDAENFFASPVFTGTYNGNTVAIPMTGLTVARPIGNAPIIPSHTGPEFGVFIVLPKTSSTIPSPCDVNKDGTVAVTDVQLAVNQAIQADPTCTSDINQDGRCGVIDVQRIVNAALGGQCLP